MERPRVVYFAKTKTAKVIQPSSLEEPHAPLASFELEAPLVLQKEHETVKTSVLSKQVSRPVQESCASRDRADVAAFSGFCSSNEANDSKPHTYIRPRSTTISCIPKQTTSNSENNFNKQQRFSYCPSSTESKDHPKNGYNTTSEKIKWSTPDTQNVPQDKRGYPVSNNSYSIRRLEKMRERHSHNEMSPGAKRHDESCSDLNMTTSKSQSVAPKPKRIYSDVAAQRASQSNSVLPVTSIHDSWSHLPPSPVLKQERFVISHENHFEFSPNHDAKRLKTNSHSWENNVLSVDKSVPNSSKATCTISSAVSVQVWTEQQAMGLKSGRKKDNILELLPDRVSTVKSLANCGDTLPETSRTGAFNSRSVTIRSTRAVQVRSSHRSQVRTNSRKPLASVGESDSEKTRKLLSTDKTISDTQLVVSNNCERPQNISEGTEHSLIEVVSETSNTNHFSAENSEGFLISEFKPNWKRNSFRLATQGYTSMSDLTSSVECLNDYGSHVRDLENPLDPKIPRNESLKSPHSNKIESLQFPNFTMTKSLSSSLATNHESSASPRVTKTKNASCLNVSKTESTRNPHVTKSESPQCVHFTITDSSPSPHVNRCKISPSHHVTQTESSRSPHFAMTDRPASPHITKSRNSFSPCDTTDRKREMNLETVLINSCPNESGTENYKSKISSNENRITGNFVFEKTEEKRESRKHCDKLDESLVHNQPFDRNGFKRLSYKMATLSITDLLMLDDGKCGGVGKGNHTSLTKRTGKNMAFNFAHFKDESQSMKSQNTCEPHNPRPEDEQLPHFKNLIEEEQSSKIKRLSFLLATSSISDLTFPDSEMDLANCKFSPGEKVSRMSDSANSTMESTHSSIYHTPESQRDPCGENSSSSSGRHSSFGSVYSARGLDVGRARASIDKSKSDLKSQIFSNKDLADSVLKPDPVNDSLASDSSASGDTSFYYTASSDASFLAADGDSRNSVNFGNTKHKSPLLNSHSQRSADHRFSRMALQTQRSKVLLPIDLSSRMPSQDQRSPRMPKQGQKSQPLQDRRSSGQPLHDQSSREYSSYDHKQNPSRSDNETDTSHGTKKTSASHHTETPKPIRPVSNVLQCYGCGLNNKQHTADAQSHWDRDSSWEQSNKSQSLEQHEKAYKRPLEDMKRHSSKHPAASVSQGRYPKWSLKDPSRQSRYSGKNDPPNLDQPSLNGIPRRTSPDSPTSFIEGFTWETTRRSPPSLGKPRRKLYAGFDSQPLPMDSFLSDSSSMYSVQSCGSWGASRSAEVESVSKTPDTSPKVRAVSSIASSTYASARDMSQDEVFDLFTYTDKHFSVSENNRNLFLNGENSLADDCFKENFYDKTFSNESLGSHISDTTTIALEQPENFDHSLDHTKPYLDHIPDRYNNTRSQSEKRSNEIHQLNKLNNSCDFESRSRLNNNGNCPAGGSRYSKNQLRSITAPSSATSPSSRFKSTENIFSSKDIYDLITSPEKSSQNGPKLLEKQAQKMTKLFCAVTQCAMQQHKNTTC